MVDSAGQRDQKEADADHEYERTADHRGTRPAQLRTTTDPIAPTPATAVTTRPPIRWLWMPKMLAASEGPSERTRPPTAQVATSTGTAAPNAPRACGGMAGAGTQRAHRTRAALDRFGNDQQRDQQRGEEHEEAHVHQRPGCGGVLHQGTGQ